MHDIVMKHIDSLWSYLWHYWLGFCGPVSHLALSVVVLCSASEEFTCF